MLFLSVPFSNTDVFSPAPEKTDITKIPQGSLITLISDSESKPIHLDEDKKFWIEEERPQVFISRGFTKQLVKRSDSNPMRNRNIISRTLPF